MVRGDAQSSNSIIARINFEINDRYSTGGMSLEEIEKAILKLSYSTHTKKDVRILERLIKKKNAALSRGDFYVSPERETLEYLQYIFAMLDDTDLLTKVTEYDVDTMASLLNRLKSIKLCNEVEVIDFDDLSRKELDFPKKAAKKLMQTPDLYSLYGAIYKAKEEAIDQTIEETGQGKETHFFQDTKILGSLGYAAVGQFKHFVLLHIMMISTVASAEELFSDSVQKVNYFDEIWFWIPNDKRAERYLQNFLTEFVKCPRVEKQHLEVELFGDKDRYDPVFAHLFLHKPVSITHIDEKFDMVVVKVEAGSIKSRKADIAAHL
jgi:hemerythrin